MIGPTIDSWNASINTWFSSLGAPVEAVVRLVLAAAFGGMIGIEREVRGRQAGFRTNLLVCVGSALVMIVSIEFAAHSWAALPGRNVNVDPARIAYGVMTGVGFLGAGVIVHAHAGIVRGLTTAAALWCVAAIGLSIGFGMYLISLLATALVVLSLWLLDYLARFVPRTEHRTLTLRRTYRPRCVDAAINMVKTEGIHVINAHFNREESSLDFVNIHLQVAYKSVSAYRDLEEKIAANPEYELMASRES